jgi:hypothetical protein
MSGTSYRLSLLAGALVLGVIAHAQEPRPLAVDTALTFISERAQIASRDCGCFWIQGGGINGAIAIFHGWSAVGSFTGEHGSDVVPGVNLSKIDYMGGPRYTFYTGRWTNRRLGSNHGTSIFGEALFGGSHAFDSVFPGPVSAKSSANSLSMQFGGGLNVALAGGFGLRALEVDYIRTSLPNGAGNTQNDLRLAIGFSYRFDRRAQTNSVTP